MWELLGALVPIQPRFESPFVQKFTSYISLGKLVHLPVIPVAFIENQVESSY